MPRTMLYSRGINSIIVKIVKCQSILKLESCMKCAKMVNVRSIIKGYPELSGFKISHDVHLMQLICVENLVI